MELKCLSGQEKATLWTRQVPEVWEEIQNQGIYRVKKEYIKAKNDTISDYYIRLYEWYTREAKKHITLSEEDKYPIWFSVDEKFMLQPVENTVVLKLEIPCDKFIICNYDAWGYCVNYWYIPLNEEDLHNHEKELKKYGVHSDDELILTDKGNFYPLLKRKVIDSWNRVFTMKPTKIEDAVGTAWQIKKEWVMEVIQYEK